MLERDTVDFVVDVQALDVLSMVLHNNIDKIIDSGVFVPDKDLAVEKFVVTEDGGDEFVINVFWGGGECNLHPTSLLGFEVDIGRCSV